MIVDCHCHAGPGDGLTGPWDTRAPLKQYLEWAQAYNITRTVLFAAFHSDYETANRAVAAIVARDRSRFIGFAFVHPDRDRGRVYRLVETAVSEYGFRGIKVHRHDGRITREICDTARVFGLPILYDVMGEVAGIRLLAEEYPGVPFIIPHLGSFADDWRAQSSFIPILERYPNVFADSSGVRRFELLQEAVARAGAGKLLFGSDGPWLHPGVELEKIRALRLTEREEKLVLADNIERLTARTRATAARPVSGGIGTRPNAADPWTPQDQAM